MSSPCQQSWPRLVTVLAANTTRLLVVCRKTKQWSPCHELTFLVYHPIAFDIMFVAKGICHKYWRFPALPVFQLLRSRPLIVPKRFISNPISSMRWFQSFFNFLLQNIRKAVPEYIISKLDGGLEENQISNVSWSHRPKKTKKVYGLTAMYCTPPVLKSNFAILCQILMNRWFSMSNVI